LDTTHSQNQNKANWFSQALGFDQSNWQDLSKQLYFDPATASDEARSTTQSGISGGSTVIRDEAAQQALTDMTPDETIASLNRDTTNRCARA